MPRRIVLSASQRASFEALPVEPVELARHYILNENDLALIHKRRRASNRIGFAVQLCLSRYPGRVLRTGEEPPAPFLAFVAEQTNTNIQDFAEYATRDQTRREHVSFLISEFGLTTFTQANFRDLVRWLRPIAVEHPKSVFLVGAVLNELRHRRILHPPLAVVERIVATAEANADHRVFNLINGRLSDGCREALDGWLSVDNDQNQSRLSWVRQPVGRPCPVNVLVILERLEAIHGLKLPGTLLDDLPPIRREMLAREGNRIAVQNLRMFGDARRHTVMAVSLLETRRALVDEAITMHDRIVGALIRKSKRKHADQLQNEGKRIKKAIGTLAMLGRALIRAKETGKDAWEAIDEAISWDDFRETVEDAQDLSKPRKLNHLHFVEAHYSQIRRYAPALLEHFDFQAAKGGQDVLDAIKLLREMNATAKRKLPENAPISFITSQWEPFIFREGGLDRRYYELCALSELRNCLRSGDIWVPGSKQYQDFDGYLMGKAAFKELHTSGDVPVAVETGYAKYMAARTALLYERLDEVNDLVKKGALHDVEIKKNGFSMKAYRGLSIPDEAKSFVQAVYANLPKIKITDLLVEVDSWTGFTAQFTHLRTGLPSEDKQGLLTVILSDAINLGLTRMAEACRGSSFKQLSWVADWYTSLECYSRALAELVNHHHRMDLVGSWGDGTTSSSDGQQFPLGD